MTLSVTYDGAPIGYPIPPTKISMPTRAELGNVSTGSVSPEDPTAALALTGWRPIYMEESACSQPRLWTGWVADRNIGRSFEQTQFIGDDARIQDTSVVDLNACLNMRLIWDTDGNRPAEYLSDRVTWLLGSAYLTGLLEDTGKVEDFGATDMMDATDYRGQFPDAVLGDCNDRTGGVLNYFVFWDTDPSSGSPRPGLFLDHLEATTYDCTVSISNLVADTYADDVPETLCFAPITESRLQRTPESVYSDVIVTYKNGSVHVYDASTEASFIRRGTTISRPHTGTTATATAQGQAYLAAHNIELDRITTTIRVPRATVGLIQAGMRMTVTFSHMPGYESGAFMRIVACNPHAVDDLARFYDVDLELVAPKSTRAVQMLAVTAAGDGNSVIHYANTYDGGPDHYPAFVSETHVTLIVGNWYRMYIDLSGSAPYSGTGQCFPGGGPPGEICYGDSQSGFDSSLQLTRSLAGHFIGPAPAWGIVKPVTAALDKFHMYGQGIYSVYADPIVGGFPVASIGDHLDVWLALDANVAGAATATATVWVEDLGPGTFAAPYATPPPPMAIPPTGGGTGGTIIPPTSGGTTTSTADPTVNDDELHGFAIGAQWINTVSGAAFVLVDATTGAAVWISTTASGGVTVADEGTPLATLATTLDFVGSGVTASGAGATKTITIPGASVPGFATPAIVLGTAAAAGAAATVIRSDSTIVAFDATNPTTQASGDSPAVGAAAVAARRDHKHGMPTIPPAAAGGTPAVVLGTAATAGSSGTFLRDDDTIAAFDATVPVVQAFGDSAAAGSVAKAARRDHVHGMPAAPTSTGELLISDTPSTPLVFADIIQNEAQDDFVYAG